MTGMLAKSSTEGFKRIMLFVRSMTHKMLVAINNEIIINGKRAYRSLTLAVYSGVLVRLNKGTAFFVASNIGSFVNCSLKHTKTYYIF